MRRKRTGGWRSAASPDGWCGGRRTRGVRGCSTLLGTEAAAVDRELLHLVVDDPLRAVEQPRRLRAVAASALQRIQDDVLFVLVHRFAERKAHLRVGSFGG